MLDLIVGCFLEVMVPLAHHWCPLKLSTQIPPSGLPS